VKNINHCMKSKLYQNSIKPLKPITKILPNNFHLKCVTMNLRSILNKLNLFHQFLSIYKPDLIFISESWLNQSILNSVITHTHGYAVIRNDRKLQSYGGALLLIKNNLHFIPLQTNVDETVAVDIFIGETVHRIILSYRQPKMKTNESVKLFSNFSDIFTTNTPFMPSTFTLIGDLNLPYIIWQNGQPHQCKSNPAVFNAVKKFCNSFNLSQLVNFPTSMKNSNILDLIFTSAKELIYEVSPFPKDTQHQIFPHLDHIIINFKMKHNKPHETPQDIVFLDFKNGEYELLNYHLLLVDWKKDLDKYESSTEKLDFIKTKIFEGIYNLKCIPQKIYSTSSSKSKNYPEILSKMKEHYLKIIKDPMKTQHSMQVGKKLFKLHLKFVKKQQQQLLSKQHNLYLLLCLKYY
jgi:hypothetical protein